MTILINPARLRFGADTAIGRLLGDEPSGLAIDFITGQTIIRDQTTPVVNLISTIGSQLTYTSPSTKRIFDVTGTMVTGTTLRCDHHPITHEPLGVLMEVSSTNKILRSQEFGTTWVPLNTTVTSDTQSSPEATMTGDTLTATSATTPGISQAVTATAAAHTLSVYAKAGTATWLRLNLTTSGSGTARSAWFDLANGVIGSKEASVVTQQMSPAGNGWYRCSITVTTAATSETATIRMVTGDNAVDGTNGATVHLWGAQLEALTHVTSYVPTTTATVARAIDTVQLATSAFPYNPTALTWIMEVIARPPITATGSWVFVRLFNSTTDRLDCTRTANTSRLTVNTRAANVTTMTEIMSSSFTADVPHKFAIAWDTTPGCGCSFDGGAVVVEPVPGVIPTNLLTLEFGNQPGGHYRGFVCLPRRAADSELPRMSWMPPSAMLLPALPPRGPERSAR